MNIKQKCLDIVNIDRQLSVVLNTNYEVKTFNGRYFMWVEDEKEWYMTVEGWAMKDMLVPIAVN